MLRDWVLPLPVEALLKRLGDAGFRAHLVGGCVRDAMLDRPVRDYDVTSNASRAELLTVFPRAVPIGRRHGTVMVPTTRGPVDVTPYRAGSDLLADLAHRDFTFNAMAFDPSAAPEARLCDPHGGVADLDARIVRAVGEPAARLAEDPLRALRALRFVSELDARLEPALAAALEAFGEALLAEPAERLRAELEALLAGAGVEQALAELARCGFTELLAPGTRRDAPGLVARLPEADLRTRLVGWLRGTDAGGILGRLRFPRRLAAEVERLVRLHPLEPPGSPAPAAWARRSLARLGPDGCAVLLQVAEAEAELAGDKARCEALTAAGKALQRAERAGVVLGPEELAIDGKRVMAVLGCGPGPQIGRALAWLMDRALDDPTVNTPGGLEALLKSWHPQGEITEKNK